MNEQDLFNSELPVLDLQVLGQIELLGDVTGVDLVGQLTVQFLGDARSRVNELHQAMVAGDRTALLRSAHNLRGASATLGATGLSCLCAALEAKADDISPWLGFRFLEAIRSELDRVQHAFSSRVHAVI
jgi:HPt (histidine-containing phosphotransfer) domain-containing protein